MKRDAAFGPVVAFGLGGTMTEVFRDIALAVSPGAEGDVAELPDLISGRALLGAFRGQPAVDRAKLVADHRGGRADRRRPPADRRDRRQPAADPRRRARRRRRPDDPVRRGRRPRRRRRAFTPDLDAVLAPRSVAIVGASGDVTRWGGSALQNILAGGFEGAIYPVNPKGGEFFGLPVSTSLEDVPAAAGPRAPRSRRAPAARSDRDSAARPASAPPSPSPPASRRPVTPARRPKRRSPAPRPTPASRSSAPTAWG